MSAFVKDRVSLWPTVAAISILLALALTSSIPGNFSFIFIPLSIIIIPVMGLTLIIMGVVNAFRRRFRAAISMSGALLIPILLSSQIIWTSDCIHLGLTLGLGVGQLGTNAKPSPGQFFVADWSTGLAVGPQTLLIYDKSDQVELPLPKQNPYLASKDSLNRDCAGSVNHLVGHYYVCTYQPG